MNPAMAQFPEVPTKYRLDKAEDYAPYQDKVLEIIGWMQRTPPSVKPDLRKKATQFVMTWINGSPDVSVSIYTSILGDLGSETSYGYSSDLSSIYLFSKTEYLINHPEETDDTKAELYAVEKVIALHDIILKKSPDSISKNVGKWKKLQSKGKLEAMLRKQQP